MREGEREGTEVREKTPDALAIARRHNKRGPGGEERGTRGEGGEPRKGVGTRICEKKGTLKEYLLAVFELCLLKFSNYSLKKKEHVPLRQKNSATVERGRREIPEEEKKEGGEREREGGGPAKKEKTKESNGIPGRCTVDCWGMASWWVWVREAPRHCCCPAPPAPGPSLTTPEGGGPGCKRSRERRAVGAKSPLKRGTTVRGEREVWRYGEGAEGKAPRGAI